MRNATRVGAIAVIFACVSLAASAGVTTSAFAQEQQAQPSEPAVVVTESHIARLKSALRLTPAQEVHWRALEAELRSVIHRQHTDESTGLVQRVRARISGYVLNAAAARRVATAAQPLIATLDDEQKQNGITAVRAMGVASLF